MATFNKELKWVITEYGKRRITELLSNPEERVRISVMQIGDDNSGEPGRHCLQRLGIRRFCPLLFRRRVCGDRMAVY